jgi:hypothetical protein
MSKHTDKTTTESGSKVIDFNEIRQQKLEEKRRKTERVFMNHFLGVYCMTGINSMHQIEMVDLSEEGCSFQVPFKPEKPFPAQQGREMPIRLYFSQDNFLQVVVTVQNTRNTKQGNDTYVRYGCKVDPTTSTFAAYQAFVRFLKAYGDVSQKDEGNINVFFV